MRSSRRDSLPGSPAKRRAGAGPASAPLLSPKEPRGENVLVDVYARVRPASQAEKDRGDKSVWQVRNAPDGGQTLQCTLHSASATGGKQQQCFRVNKVFGPADDSAAVYEAVVSDKVQSAADGINACILAYGQTGSGKTHTMGEMVERAAQGLFDTISDDPDREYSVRVSAIEVYNEKVGRRGAACWWPSFSIRGAPDRHCSAATAACNDNRRETCFPARSRLWRSSTTPSGAPWWRG